MFLNENNYRLIRKMGGEILCVEAWGENSLRVRAVQYGCKLEGRDGALIDKPVQCKAKVSIDGDTAAIVNGVSLHKSPKAASWCFTTIRGSFCWRNLPVTAVI